MENGMSNNIITIASEGGKKKKGGGTNAVLTLMKELGDFQDKVQTCIDAQDLSDRSQKLEVFYDKLDEMAEVLLEMAADGIKSKRKMEALEDDTVEDPEGDSVEEPIEDILSDKPRASSVGRIQMINAPSIPKLPR
jgi:hypothetical protein